MPGTRLLEAMRCAPACVLAVVIVATASAQSTGDSDNDGIQDHEDNCVLLANPQQVDADSDGWGNRCDGDFNNDGNTDTIDLGRMKLAFFSNDPVVDLNGDGIVNIVDLGLLGTIYFAPPGPAGYAFWVATEDGDWDQPANWFPLQVPPAEAHVFVDQPGTLTVSVPTAAAGTANLAAASVTSNQNITLTGGTLTIDGDVTMDASLTLMGGTLRKATLRSGGAGSAVTVAGTATCYQCSLATDLVVADDAQLDVVSFLQLAGGDVFLAAEQNSAKLIFASVSSFLGSGNVWFAGSSADDDANFVVGSLVRSGITFATLTGGGRIQGATLDGSVVSDIPGRRVSLRHVALAGSVTGLNGGEIAIDGAWTNAPGNVVSVTDGVLELGGTWNNQGDIILSNSPLTATGSFSIHDFAGIQTNSLTTLAGELDNSGNVLDLDDFAGGLTLTGEASISGGTLAAGDGLVITPGLSGLTLSDVTLTANTILEPETLLNATGLILAGDLELRDGSTLDGVTLTLDEATVSIASDGNFTNLEVRSVVGNGVIEFAGTTLSDEDNRIGGAIFTNSFDLGSGVAVRTVTAGGSIASLASVASLSGSIDASLGGRAIRLLSAATTLNGSLSIGAQSRVVTLSFASQFVMSESASLDIDIGPSGNGALLLDTYTFAVGGSLNLALVDGASPAACELFQIASHTASAGSFDAVTGPDLGGSAFEVVILQESTQVQAPGTGCTF